MIAIDWYQLMMTLLNLQNPNVILVNANDVRNMKIWMCFPGTVYDATLLYSAVASYTVELL